MDSEEAKKKYEDAFWLAHEEAKVESRFHLDNGAFERLTKLLHRILCDGFMVAIAHHAKDANLKGLVFTGISKEDMDAARAQYCKRYKDKPWIDNSTKGDNDGD